MMAAATRVHVAVEVEGRPVHSATAHVSERRGTVTTVMDYDPNYLRDPHAYALSPDLRLAEQRHSVSGLPGSFADSAPDRWGRNLIAKRFRAATRGAGVARDLQEVDYLLGVSDLTRQGSLRFSLEEEGAFLEVASGVPQLVALPRLLRAADEVAADRDDLAAVKMLLDAGTGSLGGARPKAAVRDDDRLLIAKFPHASDEWDVMAWEKTALDLAAACGLTVPASRLVDVGGRHVLLVERFDRGPQGRVGYISAMTLLGRRDGERADYLEIAEALSEHGSAVSRDLVELWRRIAFSVVVNNVDDHLRNHGLLRDRAGWHLSPLFDVNPDPSLTSERVTSIGFVSGAQDARDALVTSAPDFGLDEASAKAAWDDIVTATADWGRVARSNGVAASSCERFAPVLNRFRG